MEQAILLSLWLLYLEEQFNLYIIWQTGPGLQLSPPYFYQQLWMIPWRTTWFITKAEPLTYISRDTRNKHSASLSQSLRSKRQWSRSTNLHAENRSPTTSRRTNHRPLNGNHSRWPCNDFCVTLPIDEHDIFFAVVHISQINFTLCCHWWSVEK